MESAHLICLECLRSTGGPRRGSSWLDPATRRLRALHVGRDQKFYRRGFRRGFPMPDRPFARKSSSAIASEKQFVSANR
jgi:hypothetical protein